MPYDKTTVQDGPLMDAATWGGVLPLSTQSVSVEHQCTLESGQNPVYGDMQVTATGAILVCQAAYGDCSVTCRDFVAAGGGAVMDIFDVYSTGTAFTFTCRSFSIANRVLFFPASAGMTATITMACTNGGTVTALGGPGQIYEPSASCTVAFTYTGGTITINQEATCIGVDSESGAKTINGDVVIAGSYVEGTGIFGCGNYSDDTNTFLPRITINGRITVTGSAAPFQVGEDGLITHNGIFDYQPTAGGTNPVVYNAPVYGGAVGRVLLIPTAAEAAIAAAQLATDKAAVIAAKADIRLNTSILGTTGSDRGTLDITTDNTSDNPPIVVGEG